MKCITFIEIKMYLYAICYVIFTFFFNNRIVETWYRNVKANIKVSFFRPSPIRPSRRAKNVTWESKLFGMLDISMSWLDFVTVKLFPQSTSILPTWLFLYNVTISMLPPHFDSINLFFVYLLLCTMKWYMQKYIYTYII